MIRGRKRIVANKTRRKGVLRPREVEVAQVALSLGVARPDELHLDVVLREHVRAVMVACRKNVSLAAAVLGTHRRTLQRWLAADRRRGRDRGRARRVPR